jgi:hypothetical protein
VIDAERDFATMQDFIVGRLSDDEQRTFENRLVRETELVRELEQSLRMREGLQRLRTKGYFAETKPRVRSFRIWVPALAAAACAGLALFLWLSHATGPAAILLASLESRAASQVGPSVTAHFTFVSVRGASTPELVLPSTGLIEIRAAASTRDGVHRYRLMLVRQDERGSTVPVGALTGLAVGTDGYVHCYADSSRLVAGSYVLRVQPDSDTAGMAEVFAFNLRAGGTGLSP